jgi:uncharacterized protein
MVYHEGERSVQLRAGASDDAARISSILHDSIPPVAKQFLHEQPVLFVGSSTLEGQMWASVLEGLPGFLQVQDERRLRVNAVPSHGDPLSRQLVVNKDIGLLAIEFSTRRRMRVNGHIIAADAGGFEVSTEEVYSNCPKYIQTREFQGFVQALDSQVKALFHRSSSLDHTQKRWIESADTFFIATRHPDCGTDISHRGGCPGFVRAEGEASLVFPDYPGNNMFNTLGNLDVNPQAGLLFVDFINGHTLQLSGTASVNWNRDDIQRVPGAERIVRFKVEEVLQRCLSLQTKWRFEEYSPYNPAMGRDHPD